MRMYDITTGTGDFIANGVVSHNCFARPTHTYLDFDAGRDFEREIVVKVNAPEVLRAELARPSWKREHVALGTNTDPYQWVEGRYRLMEGIWEALRDARNPCSILTKSPLLLRDLDADARDRRAHELHGVPVDPDARREGLARNRAAHAEPARAPGGGRRAEPRRHPDRRADRAADAGDQRRAPTRSSRCWRRRRRPARRNIAGIALHLRGEVRDVFMGWLRDDAPGSGAALRASSTAAAPMRRSAERERLSRLVRRGGRPGAFWRIGARGAGATRRHGPPPDDARASAQQALVLRRRAEPPRSALVALAGGHLRGRCSSEPIRRATARRAVSGARLAKTAPARSGSGATSISPRLRSIAAHDRLGDVLGRARADARRQLRRRRRRTCPASRMKPGKTRRDADAAAVQVRAQRRRRSRAARTCVAL